MADEKAAAAKLRRQERKTQEKVKVQLLANLSGTGKYMQIVEVSLTRAWMLTDNNPPWARWPAGTIPPKRPGRSIDRADLPPRAVEVVAVFDPNMAPVDGLES